MWVADLSCFNIQQSWRQRENGVWECRSMECQHSDQARECSKIPRWGLEIQGKGGTLWTESSGRSLALEGKTY